MFKIKNQEVNIEFTDMWKEGIYCQAQPKPKLKLGAELVLISTNTDPTRPTRNSTFQSESDTTYKEKVVSLYE